eukprot:6174589-Pleurochrysis_carterae.AAC.6
MTKSNRLHGNQCNKTQHLTLFAVRQHGGVENVLTIIRAIASHAGGTGDAKIATERERRLRYPELQSARRARPR